MWSIYLCRNGSKLFSKGIHTLIKLLAHHYHVILVEQPAFILTKINKNCVKSKSWGQKTCFYLGHCAHMTWPLIMVFYGTNVHFDNLFVLYFVSHFTEFIYIYFKIGWLTFHPSSLSLKKTLPWKMQHFGSF